MPRLIHYTLKIADRQKARGFFVDTLGMRVLRHEEYDEGCKVECNGPFQNRWSKTLVGYGSEDKHFVLELVYNYKVSKYEKGNDFFGIFIESTEAYARCTEKLPFEIVRLDNVPYVKVLDPDGHAFFIKEGTRKPEPIFKIGLNTNDLFKTVYFWVNIMGMKELLKASEKCIISYENNQCSLEWHMCSEPLERGNGYGRVAFTFPTKELPDIQKKLESENQKIIFPLQQLGDKEIKESVIIVADPNAHEVCFVGEDEFLKLSEESPDANDSLVAAMEKENA